MHQWDSAAYYGDSIPFVYVDDVRTAQETHLSASTTCEGDSVPFVYVDYVRTVQEISVDIHVLLRG
jgi:hypothetical protein